MTMNSAGISKTFPPLKNDLILRAAKGQFVERVPVWIMRQAGRYLPEFQVVRSKHEFFEVVRTPELACELTLQPLDRFDLDAAIIFSDILVIPQALGMVCEMIPGKGPTFPNPLENPDDIDKLNIHVDVHKELGYVMEAITLTRHKLEGKVPLIGFAGAPWTLMSYMIEGGGSTTHSKAKKWFYSHSEASHKLLQILTDVIVEYITAQVMAGAQLIQIFDSHAGILDEKTFLQFGLPYIKQISTRVRENLDKNEHPQVPMIIFAKGAHYAIKDLSSSGYDVIGLDWTISPSHARSEAGDKISFQGNMDPCAMYANEDDIFKMVEDMLAEFGTKNYIANLGHGIYPDFDPDHIKVFINAVHHHSLKMIENQL